MAQYMDRRPFNLALLEMTKRGFWWADPKLDARNGAIDFEAIVPAVSLTFNDCTAETSLDFGNRLTLYRGDEVIGDLNFYTNDWLKESCHGLEEVELQLVINQYPEVAESAGLTNVLTKFVQLKEQMRADGRL